MWVGILKSILAVRKNSGWLYPILPLLFSFGCSIAGKSPSPPEHEKEKKKVQVMGKLVESIPGFTLLRMEEDSNRRTLIFEMPETMEQFAKKLKEDDGFQIQFHQFWWKMADTFKFQVYGFLFKTISSANTTPIQFKIEGAKKGPLPSYLQRGGDGDNEKAFDYIIAQSTYVKKLTDPISGRQVEKVEVTPFSRSFSTPRTRLIIPIKRYKTILSFSTKASEAERKDFWGLVAAEIGTALAEGKFVEMEVHCGDLHYQAVGHFHYRLSMY